MRNIFKIISVISLALSFLGAAELIRPKILLTPTPEGVRVKLDFGHISELQWHALLENPSNFHEYGYGVSGAPGDAALPLITEVIPVSSIYEPIISASAREAYTLNSVELKASPEGHLDSQPQSLEISNYDWNKTDRSVHESIMLGDMIRLKGESFLPVTIRPILLNSESRSLSIPTQIEFEIQGLQISEVTGLTEDGGIRSVISPEEHFARKGHYLILTPSVFEASIQYLVNWKLRQGYEVTLVNTMGIGTSASSIKAFIQEAWDTWESRPDYLLLIGDEDRGIPGHYVQNPQGDNLITDHPYALLEGDDSFPELMVGRLSVDTMTELLAFSAKIVAYESDPYMVNPDWFKRGLMISTNWGAASAQATKEWVADKLIENGFDEVYTAYHPIQTAPTAISTPINQGVGFVNYRGFGMYNGWFGPDFTNDNIANLISNGAKTPVITSVVCGGGNFASDVDPCFGEKWTRLGTFSSPKGAVAFFGPSELYTHTQFNNVIDIGIYSGIFDQGITTLGEALWNGKYELWRNYHQNSYFPFNQTPEFYHHIYNLMGDPGMQLWTDIPQAITVGHPDTLLSGDNSIYTTVEDASGTAIAGAYVSFYNDENALGGYTELDGSINIPFTGGDESEIMITVTGPNLQPYLATLPIESAEHSLILNNWTLDSGDQLIAGTSEVMTMNLSNPGLDLNVVSFEFSSVTQGVVMPAPFTINNFPAGDTLLNDLEISVGSGVPHGTPVQVILDIQAETETWRWFRNFTVQSPVISIGSVDVLSGLANAGDSAHIEIELLNVGGAPSGEISLTPLEHEHIIFSDDFLTCPTVDMDGSALISSSLGLSFDEQLFPGEIVRLRFECVRDGLIDTLEANLQLGEVLRYGPSQADEYGYRMFDNFDLAFSKAQPYDWIELAPASGGSGINLGLFDAYEEADASTILELPFPVTYYGETFNQITVCTNGWAAFGPQSVVNFHNRIIPSTIGPLAMLAPFWDDLVTNPGYVLHKTSPTNDVYIIEWYRMRSLGHQTDLSFQIIFFNTEDFPTQSGDNDFKFQYRIFENADVSSNFATIGIESPNSTVGLTASYNNISDPSIGRLGNESAILFTTDRGERLPDAVASISSNSLHFIQNPWSIGQDSIIITNVGESPLAYNITLHGEPDLAPAPPALVDPNLAKSTPDAIPNHGGASREGSDEYGYSWRKNTDENGPVYQWVNIEMPENAMEYDGDPDDDSIGPTDLGFEFPLYDRVFTQTYIGANGTLTFESAFSPWSNIGLPSQSGPASILAPWWDDLNNDNGPQGTIYFWTNNVDQCIFTWKDFPKWGTSDVYTFQVILDAYGSISYQYQTIDGPTTSVTVGMQNSSRSIGLSIHYNESTPFPAETAISISRPVQWLAASGWTGQIDPGESEYFVVSVQPQNLAPGHYEVPMTMSTSATNLLETELIVSLDVSLGEHPWGDVNSDYMVNINDLMGLLDFVLVLQEMNEDQYNIADLSNDDEVDVIDVILLLENILNTN